MKGAGALGVVLWQLRVCDTHRGDVRSSAADSEDRFQERSGKCGHDFMAHYIKGKMTTGLGTSCK